MTAEDGSNIEYTDILKAMADNDIFTVEKNSDGTVTFTENCDCYFSVILSDDEVKTLGRRLLAL